jgi:hypothetical protein
MLSHVKYDDDQPFLLLMHTLDVYKTFNTPPFVGVSFLPFSGKENSSWRTGRVPHFMYKSAIACVSTVRKSLMFKFFFGSIAEGILIQRERYIGR